MRHRFHGLKKIKIRQSWNKYNLFNLSRVKRQDTKNATYYQQKWLAKSNTRAYHGEQIREGQWEQMFKPASRSTVNMDHRYLAQNDGSEQARGRGSGLQLGFGRDNRNQPVPYMHMTYAPTERRLDVAIFRALFASSTRQARQMVVHGGVKVNGKKMIYPGYLLNPGDMFQVEPERVLFATGAMKDVDDRAATRRARKAIAAKEEKNKAEEEGEASGAVEISPVDQEAKRKAHKVELKALLNQAKDVLESTKDTASAKRKQQLRAFTSTVRKAMGDVNNKTSEGLDEELNTLFSQLELTTPSARAPVPAASESGDVPQQMSKADREALREALLEIRENPTDPTKPYATPWRPRPYMSPFAFIPKYLEVNQNICSAVYLRHPVARAGLAEVPTPFTMETSQLAFNWYLRRR